MKMETIYYTDRYRLL